MAETASDQNSYNRGGYIAFIFSMAFTILFFIWISFIHEGVDLKEVTDPNSAPSQQAPAPEEAAPDAPSGSSGQLDDLNLQNSAPWVSSVAQVDRGHELYSKACATCHGIDGKGTGPAARNTHPRDLVTGQWKFGGDSIALFNTITQGVDGTGMAAFAYMPASDRWALVHYIRSITQNLVADNQDRLLAEAATLN